MLSDRIVIGEAGHVPPQLHLVPWWSFTKTVLAGAALVLVAQRRLDLHEPLSGTSYSLCHLLQHTSGLPDYGGVPEYEAAVAARQKPWPQDELLRRVRGDKLLFEPGRSWSYSNIGYLFIRQMIERETGLELDDALRMLLFKPLGIESVFVAKSVGDLEHTIWGNGHSYDPGWVYHGLAVGSPFAAASLLHRMLYGPLFEQHLKTELLNPVSVGGPFSGRPFVFPSYGLGVMIDSKNPLGFVAGHTGQGPGSTAAIYSFPELREPRTLAAFIADDTPEAPGILERHLQTLVNDDRLHARSI
jgi:D-alanyl-D-alanine carboxypeptidase